ncbi:MAG: YjbQ family protein [Deltaproteobacteria bacterium]|nr:YjbQ family protein [Deltaproteobacteria bacterium]
MIQLLQVHTGSRTEFVEVTAEVERLVRQSGVSEGLCHLFVPHTTAGLTINENADPTVKADILMALNKLISEHEPYRHREGNSPAHIKASLMGSGLTLLVEGGRLVLGAWQGIFFCEFDGPRSRRLLVKIVSG